MTHDLIKNILDAQGVALARLEITELTNGTFYSEMYLKQDDASMVISARPSDGIALAIRMGAPIYAAEPVIEEAGYPADDEEEREDVVEQFREFIDSVDPEDFAS
jgi:bifunctional DNase/RNase